MGGRRSIVLATSVAVAVAASVAGCGRFEFDHADGGALPAGLVAWYTMDDDPADGSVVDLTGLTGDARCTPGACPALATGHLGGAAHFTGVEKLRFPDPGTLATGAVTIAAWIELDDTTRTNYPIAKPYGGDDDDTWGFWLQSDRACFETMTGIGDEAVCMAWSPSTGVWMHIAATADGARRRLFLDGALAAEDVQPNPLLFDDHSVVIGADEDPGLPFNAALHGGVDDFRIYDRALTAVEIAALAGS